VVWVFTPLRASQEILDLVMEPVVISDMMNLEGYAERTGARSVKCIEHWMKPDRSRAGGSKRQWEWPA